MSDSLKVEWTADTVYLVLGEAEMQLTRVETESLFVVLGQALQDQDKLKEEADEREAEEQYAGARERSSNAV